MTSYSYAANTHSSRNQFIEPPSVIGRTKDLVQARLSPHLRRAELFLSEKTGHKIRLELGIRGFEWKRLLTFANVLTLFWIIVLWRSEHGAFSSNVGSCHWRNWEQWSSNANPHHLVFVTDPQLVDPHTYPGRPWPLSTLTVKHTDVYLRRAFSQILKRLKPDTVIFLGDLFDGGREWSTEFAQNPDTQWQKWGQSTWMNEYRRFGRIFVNSWEGDEEPREGQDGKKILMGLPGNHDLGFASGVHTAVRDRFNAYFGDGNRVDVIGNHTFVSVDTVSLSAMNEDQEKNFEIWKKSIDFLKEVKHTKNRAVSRTLRTQAGLSPHQRYEHRVMDTDELPDAKLPSGEVGDSSFPTVLLSHVPLYRVGGTPCGPQRERYPPTKPPNGQTEPVVPDDRNAIAVLRGYQYQNVLDPQITKDLTDYVGDVGYAFSGDDHDYCEVLHRSYSSAGGGIREITVKSLSWAMGVRYPGFVMASLWNPVDQKGRSIEPDALKEGTMQTHLCLLPDQLGIFIKYAIYIVISMLLIAWRAILVSRRPPPINSSDNSILPTSTAPSSAEAEKAADIQTRTNGSTDTRSRRATLSQRPSRTGSPAVGGYGFSSGQTQGGYGVPLIHQAGYYGPERKDHSDERRDALKQRIGEFVDKSRGRVRQLRGWKLIAYEFGKTLLRIGGIAILWWFWLLR